MLLGQKYPPQRKYSTCSSASCGLLIDSLAQLITGLHRHWCGESREAFAVQTPRCPYLVLFCSAYSAAFPPLDTPGFTAILSRSNLGVFSSSMGHKLA